MSSQRFLRKINNKNHGINQGVECESGFNDGSGQDNEEKNVLMIEILLIFITER
jgi:hypothetical protein